MIDVLTLLEAFLNISLKSACFIDEVNFLVKSKMSGLDTIFLKCRIIKSSQLSDIKLNKFLCICLHSEI